METVGLTKKAEFSAPPRIDLLENHDIGPLPLDHVPEQVVGTVGRVHVCQEHRIHGTVFFEGNLIVRSGVQGQNAGQVDQRDQYGRSGHDILAERKGDQADETECGEILDTEMGSEFEYPPKPVEEAQQGCADWRKCQRSV